MRRKQKPLKIVEVEITSIAHKGLAVGRTAEGMVVFTHGSVPGDLSKVALHRRRKGVWNGKTTEVLRPSNKRVKPVCQHFGVCGGCSWQNLNYNEQLIQKETIVRDTLQRIAKIKEDVMDNILPAIQTERYRNKLEFTFSANRWLSSEEIQSKVKIDSTLALGFHRPESFDKIVDIKTCWLQPIISDEIRNGIRDYAIQQNLSFYQIKNHTGLLRNLIIRVNQKEEVMLILSISEENSQIYSLFDFLKENFPQIINAFLVINRKKNDTLFDLPFQKIFGPDYLIEELNHVRFYISPKSFFQTNTRQTVQLYTLVEEYAELQGHEIVYDLYCGVGSIGIFLSRNCKKLIGIEEIPEAIHDAIQNSVLNNLANATFFAGDVKNILDESFVVKEGKPDVIILDPPRVGLHEDVIQKVLTLNPEKIVYVSCNPATFARDLIVFEEKYELTKLKPVDMFPHTNHVESIAQLIRR